MVDIIRHGRKNIAECVDCGNVLRFSADDLYRTYEPPRGPYEMEGYERYYIMCPCGSEVSVEASYSMRKKADERNTNSDIDDLL